MQSKAATVQEYLAQLPDDRRAAIESVRNVILDNIDKTISEGMQYGMIGYCIPHGVYPAGYHCDPKQPLPYAGLASQKNYMSLYLGCVYVGADGERSFRTRWAKTGKKLDMGKSCIRFKRVEDLALDVIAQTLREVSAEEYIKRYEAALSQTRTAGKRMARSAAKNGAKAAVKSAPAKKKPAMKSAKRSRAAAAR